MNIIDIDNEVILSVATLSQIYKYSPLEIYDLHKKETSLNEIEFIINFFNNLEDKTPINNNMYEIIN